MNLNWFIFHIHNPCIGRQILFPKVFIILIIPWFISFEINLWNIMIIFNFGKFFRHEIMISYGINILIFIIIIWFLLIFNSCRHIGIFVLERTYYFIHFVYLIVHCVQRNFVLALESLNIHVFTVSYLVSWYWRSIFKVLCRYWSCLVTFFIRC